MAMTVWGQSELTETRVLESAAIPIAITHAELRMV